MFFGLKLSEKNLRHRLLKEYHSSITSVHFKMSETKPKYTVLDNIRKVDPYFQTIRTTVKERWCERTVLDVFSSEFRAFTSTEYKRRLEKNEIVVIHPLKLTKKEKKERLGTDKPKLENKTIIKYPEIMDHKLSGNDIIERIEHIHERSIYGVRKEELEVIFDSEDLLVVNKPSGVPIHPVQNYYYNSLVKILENEGWPNQKKLNDGEHLTLRPCYRLDKLTSGVCVLAKNFETARKIQMDIQNREVEKVYIARVNGKFPDKQVICNHDIIILDTKKGKTDGITRKPAQTSFELVSYNETLNQSIVRCYPKTGRTHQIRIHLRNLQHPIVNDPLYGVGRLMELKEGDDFYNVSEAYFDAISDKAELNRLKAESNDNCEICDVSLYTQQKSEDMVMYLHAYKYKLKSEDGWEFETKLPEWAAI